MDRYSWLQAAWAWAVLLAQLVGCATVPPVVLTVPRDPTDPIRNNVRLGTKFLIPNDGGFDASMDLGGQIHIVSAVLSHARLFPEGDLHYYTLQTDSATDRGVAADLGTLYMKPASIAVDGTGRVHVALYDRHLLLENGIWRIRQTPPWQFRIRDEDPISAISNVQLHPLLSAVGQDAAVGFPVLAAHIGDSWEMHWTIGCLPPASLICFPIRYGTSPQKLVVAKYADFGWQSWSGIELGNRTSISDFRLVLGQQRTAHVLYASKDAKEPAVAYAHIRFDQSAVSGSESGAQGIARETVPVELTSAKSLPLENESVTSWLHCPVLRNGMAMAVDPVSDHALIAVIRSNCAVDVRIVENDVIGGPRIAPFKAHQIATAPGSDGGFHVLAVSPGPGFLTKTILYIGFRNGQWTESRPLAEVSVLSMTNLPADIRIVSAGLKAALAIWKLPGERKIVAQWIEWSSPE